MCRKRRANRGKKRILRGKGGEPRFLLRFSVGFLHAMFKRTIPCGVQDGQILSPDLFGGMFQFRPEELHEAQAEKYMGKADKQRAGRRIEMNIQRIKPALKNILSACRTCDRRASVIFLYLTGKTEEQGHPRQDAFQRYGADNGVKWLWSQRSSALPVSGRAAGEKMEA